MANEMKPSRHTDLRGIVTGPRTVGIRFLARFFALVLLRGVCFDRFDMLFGCGVGVIGSATVVVEIGSDGIVIVGVSIEIVAVVVSEVSSRDRYVGCVWSMSFSSPGFTSSPRILSASSPDTL
jgi:hypothetical protein